MMHMAGWEVFWQRKQGLNLELFQVKTKGRSNLCAHGMAGGAACGKALVHHTDDLALIPALQPCDTPNASFPPKKM